MMQNMIQQMIKCNPLYKRAEQMAQGKSENELKQVAVNLCKQRGFDNQAVMNKLNGLESGLCDGFYAVNTSLLNGFNGTQQAINNVAVAGMQNTNALASQLSDCCCTTQRSIDAVRYESAQLFSHYGTACNNGCGC